MVLLLAQASIGNVDINVYTGTDTAQMGLAQ